MKVYGGRTLVLKSRPRCRIGASGAFSASATKLNDGSSLKQLINNKSRCQTSDSCCCSAFGAGEASEWETQQLKTVINLLLRVVIHGNMRQHNTVHTQGSPGHSGTRSLLSNPTGSCVAGASSRLPLRLNKEGEKRVQAGVTLRCFRGRRRDASQS